jgi:hypothetical protein
MDGARENGFALGEQGWRGSCLNHAEKLMSNSGQLPGGVSRPRRARKAKSRRRTTRGHGKTAVSDHSGDPELAAPGSLTRTKALLLAALRVWELKHRISD